MSIYLVPLLKVDEGIVLDLLDPVHLAVPLEQLPQALLGDCEGEVAAVEDLHLGHRLLVRLLLEVIIIIIIVIIIIIT